MNALSIRVNRTYFSSCVLHMDDPWREVGCPIDDSAYSNTIRGSLSVEGTAFCNVSCDVDHADIVDLPT
jgi:hypothetical protein